jgi:hypothetical protein
MEEPEVDISGSVFDAQRFGDDNCFLCGALLQEEEKTREHVFPGWLQHRHNLWGQTLTLINGTQIPYSKLTIPCCTPCNTGHLSSVESRIRTAVEGGYAEAVKLDPLIIYQWIGKLFYGILRKELSLLHDRRDKTGPTIIPRSILERFSSLHLFLQSIRQPFEFPMGVPYSALVVNLHQEKGYSDFDFRDNLQHMTASLRTKDVGFIVTLQDVGITTSSYGKYLAEVAGRKLLLIQFDELFAKCLYQVSLLNRTPEFLTATNVDPSVTTQVFMTPSNGLHPSSLVDKWDQETYTRVLAIVMNQSHPNLDFDTLPVAPGLVPTWMVDSEGKLLLVDADGKRIPVEEAGNSDMRED